MCEALFNDECDVGRVVYGIELYQVQPGRGELDSVRSSTELGPYAGVPESKLERVQEILDSLNAGYARKSLRVLEYALLGYPEPEMWFERDGSRHVPKRDALAAAPGFRVEQEIDRRQWATDVFASFGPPDPAEIAHVTELVGIARSHDVPVTIVLMPQHPRAIELLEGSGFDGKQAALAGSMREHCRSGARVLDLTNVTSFGGDPDGFYDHNHFDSANGAKVLQAVARGDNDLCLSSPS